MTFFRNWFNRIIQQAIVGGITLHLETLRQAESEAATLYFLRSGNDEI